MSTGRMQRLRRRTLDADDATPPRWMLKTSLPFQQSNLDRVAGQRLTRKAAGKKSAHLVARDYRNTLASSFDSFDSCRATWVVDVQTRQEQQRTLDSFTVDELAQHCLDLLIFCVKGGSSCAVFTLFFTKLCSTVRLLFVRLGNRPGSSLRGSEFVWAPLPWKSSDSSAGGQV